jgi:hypothetical protein
MIEGVQATMGQPVNFKVFTTTNRGFTPEEVADKALEKFISISDTADEKIKVQALVYKEQIRTLLVFYMKEAIRSDRTTLSALLHKQGHSDIARIIEKL